MITIRCCVIDDEPLAAQLIAAYIEKTPFMELVGVYASAQDAIKPILDENIDVFFLDINMPQLNGIEFAKIVPSRSRVIFTTAYDNYAIQGFKVNALDYLMKPISYEEFVGAANKALQWAELSRQASAQADNREYIIVKSEYKLIQIAVNDILYIEGLKDYVKIFVEGESKPILSLMSMKNLEDMLPVDRFVRVHRSFIVQPEKIKVIERGRIVFGHEYIPISDNYKQRLQEAIERRSIWPK